MINHSKNEGPDEASKIPVSTLFRWFLYDIDDNPDQCSHIFGLTPVSDEGHGKETADSVERLDRIDDLIEFLNLYSNMTAQYVVANQGEELRKIANLSDDEFKKESDKLAKIYMQVTFSGLIAAFSSAAELGLITLEGAIAELTVKEQDDNE